MIGWEKILVSTGILVTGLGTGIPILHLFNIGTGFETRLDFFQIQKSKPENFKKKSEIPIVDIF